MGNWEYKSPHSCSNMNQISVSRFCRNDHMSKDSKHVHAVHQATPERKKAKKRHTVHPNTGRNLTEIRFYSFTHTLHKPPPTNGKYPLLPPRLAPPTVVVCCRHVTPAARIPPPALQPKPSHSPDRRPMTKRGKREKRLPLLRKRARVHELLTPFNCTCIPSF